MELEDVQATICSALNCFNGIGVIAADLESNNLHEAEEYENLSIVMFIEEQVLDACVAGTS